MYSSSNNRLIAARPRATRLALPRTLTRFAYNRTSHGFDVSFRAFSRLLLSTRAHVPPSRLTGHLASHEPDTTRASGCQSFIFIDLLKSADDCTRRLFHARVTIQLLLFIAALRYTAPFDANLIEC